MTDAGRGYKSRMPEIEDVCGDIIASSGMRAERAFMQHGSVSVFEHSLSVTAECLDLADVLEGVRCCRLRVGRGFVGCRLRLRIAKLDRRALSRGALLHDYFLYDWHEPGHAWHGFRHADEAMRRACIDFSLGKTERDMIRHHMFPLNPFPPVSGEGVILCAADKICAARETAEGIKEKLSRRRGRGNFTDKRS